MSRLKAVPTEFGRNLAKFCWRSCGVAASFFLSWWHPVASQVSATFNARASRAFRTATSSYMETSWNVYGTKFFRNLSAMVRTVAFQCRRPHQVGH